MIESSTLKVSCNDIRFGSILRTEEVTVEEPVLQNKRIRGTVYSVMDLRRVLATTTTTPLR